VILLSPKRGADARFRAALAPLVGAIPVETMRKANYSVDRDADKQSPAQAAAALGASIGH
jgi:osmoprotectant transport system permease protein